MRYYYLPSTYFGFRGRGYGRGGGHGHNGGYLVGCGRGGSIEEVTEVIPEDIIKKANFIEQAAMAKTESKAAPAQIPKERYDLWKWLSDGKDMTKEWIKDKYARFRNFKSSRLNRMNLWRLDKQEAGKKWLSGKYDALKEWIKDKYARLRNFKSSRLNRMYLWGLDKKEKFDKKVRALGEYVRGTKLFAVASIKTMKNAILRKLRSLGINIYAYGMGTAEVLGDSIVEAIKLAYQVLQDAGRGVINLTTEVIVAIGKAMKETGWTAVQVAVAINILRNPHTFKQQMITKAMDWVPRIADIGVSAAKSYFTGIPSLPTGKGWGAGVFNMGAGYKRMGGRRRRRGRFVKGSPEAKAYMRYLRSLRRKR